MRDRVQAIDTITINPPPRPEQESGTIKIINSELQKRNKPRRSSFLNQNIMKNEMINASIENSGKKKYVSEHSGDDSSVQSNSKEESK